MLTLVSEQMPNESHTAYLLLPDFSLEWNWKSLALMLVNIFK